MKANRKNQNQTQTPATLFVICVAVDSEYRTEDAYIAKMADTFIIAARKVRLQQARPTAVIPARTTIAAKVRQKVCKLSAAY